MSFFFSEKKRKPVTRRAVSAKPAQAGRASKEMLNRLGCQVCPLNKAPNYHPKMEPHLAAKPGGIYFLGEGVSDEADEHNTPFSDDCGRMLDNLVGRRVYYSYDNVVRDYADPTGGSPSWVAMECCRNKIIASIETAKPKLIVGLGIQPLQWMLNSSDMIGLRGRVFAVKVGQHACWFMPSYHPQFIIDNAYEGKDPLRSKLGHCLKFDMQRAIRLWRELPTAQIDTPQQARAGVQAFNGRRAGQLAQVLTLISEARKAPKKAIDWETYPLRPYAADAKVLTCAISFKSTNFAFAIDHPQAGWKPHEKEQIKKALRELLSDQTTIIAHNAPFEIEWAIYLLGVDTIFHDVWECTMMQAHFLDERRGKRGGNDDQFQPNPYQALDFLVRQHFGLSYKGLFKINRKRMDQADLDETLLYNGADTKYTLRLFSHQAERLRNEGLQSAYYEAVGRQPAVAIMQSLGIHASQKVNKEFKEKLSAEIKVIEDRIRAVPEVKDFTAKYRDFNIGSQPEVIRLFKENFKVGKAIINSEGKESVDKAFLQKIKHPIGKDFEDWRNRSKLKSTYVDPFTLGSGEFIWPDGKIHPSFNTTFAETGRTSCAAAWTKIQTDKGVKRLVNVCLNDWVWTHAGNWRRVTALWRKGVQPMFNVHLSNGAILTCTKDHRVLSANDGWKTVGDLHGIFQEMGSNRRQQGESPDTVPIKADVISEGNRSETKNNGFQCLVGDSKLYANRRVQDFKNFEVFGLKVGREEPNERVGWGKVPTLERHLRRQQRLPNNKAQWEAYFSSPRCPATGIENPVNSTGMGSSSHRRKSTQQQSRQSSTGDQKRAQGYPLKNATGQQVITIEKIEACGSSEVFDLTVEGDASYESCGIFSHNSDEPNQQNWPSRNDKWVRRQIVAPKGHVLVAFDYGQLEGCTGAMCSRDKTFVKALWEDYDMHMEWAQRAAHLWPDYIGGKANLTDKAAMKAFRSLIKNKLVFPAFFGAAKESIAGYLTVATGVEAPKHIIEKLFNEFWQAFSGVANWQKRLMNDYYDQGYVESPTGRRRHYPLGRPQAINYPIQSVACDIVCRAMVRLSVDAADTGNWYLHPTMNIHDDLTLCIPDDPKILEPAIEHIYKVMLNPGYDFVNVPLSVTCSIGNNWLDMDEIGKFWSHKDL